MREWQPSRGGVGGCGSAHCVLALVLVLVLAHSPNAARAEWGTGAGCVREGRQPAPLLWLTCPPPPPAAVQYRAMLDADRAARLAGGSNRPKVEEPKKKSEWRSGRGGSRGGGWAGGLGGWCRAKRALACCACLLAVRGLVLECCCAAWLRWRSCFHASLSTPCCTNAPPQRRIRRRRRRTRRARRGSGTRRTRRSTRNGGPCWSLLVGAERA